jgi:hypothetical protein
MGRTQGKTTESSGRARHHLPPSGRAHPQGRLVSIIHSSLQKIIPQPSTARGSTAVLAWKHKSTHMFHIIFCWERNTGRGTLQSGLCFIPRSTALKSGEASSIARGDYSIATASKTSLSRKLWPTQTLPAMASTTILRATARRVHGHGAQARRVGQKSERSARFFTHGGCDLGDEKRLGQWKCLKTKRAGLELKCRRQPRSVGG